MRSWWVKLAVLLLPALAAILLFAPIRSHGFVYDDLVILEQNPYLKSWEGVWKGFGVPHWETVSSTRHAADFYRPVGIAAFTVLWQAGGGDPTPFHRASIALHALCALLIAGLALHWQWHPLAAAAAGTLFALHGAHAEPVAWASALTFLLATAFSLLALLACSRQRWTLCALALLPAMLSHETAFGAAGLCLLIGLRHSRPRWPAAAPLLAAVLLVYLLRWQAFDHWSGSETSESLFALVPDAVGYGWLDQIALALALIGHYLAFLIWPWPHRAFRPLDLQAQIDDPRLWAPALLGLAVLLLGAWWWWKRERSSSLVRYGLGLCWFALLPTLSVWNLGHFPFEERYPYLASAGFCWLLAGLLFGSGPQLPAVRRLGSGLALAVLASAGHAYSARRALSPWESNLKFVDWARAESGNALMSHVEYAAELLTIARRLPPGTAQRAKILEGAIDVLNGAQALRQEPWFYHPADWLRLHSLLGSALLLDQDYSTAEAFYRELLVNAPLSPEAHTGMGNVLMARAERTLARGEGEAARSDLQQALEHFGTALRGDENLREALYGAGKCLIALGDAATAAGPLQRAYELGRADPAYAEAYAEALIQAQRYQEARSMLREHIEQHPDSFAGPFMTGVSYAAEGEQQRFAGNVEPFLALTRQALPWFQRALGHGPANDKAAFEIGRCWVELGRYGDGLPYLEQAFAARPSDPKYATYLLAAQEQLGFPARAAATAARHLEAAPNSPMRAQLEEAQQRLMAQFGSETPH